MKIKSFLILAITIVLLSGCAKNEVVKRKNYKIDPFDSNINIGVMSFVGNSFEYFNSKQTFNNVFRYTEVNDWHIDEFISNELKDKMLQVGFTNVQKLIPSKQLILDKNKHYHPGGRRTYLNKYFFDFMKKNNLDLVLYVENLPYYRIYNRKIGIRKDDNTVIQLDNRNFSIRDTEGLFTNRVLLNTNMIIYLFFVNIETKENVYKSTYSYGVLDKDIDRSEFIPNIKIYDQKNLKKLEPIFKDMVIKNINSFIRIRDIRIK